MMRLIQKFPLYSAFILSLLLAASVSLALYLNDDWRQTTFALLEVVVNEAGEEVQRVKVERPEPNREQVREIARNQELKQREKLQENAEKLRKAVLALEEVVEARVDSLVAPDAWDDLAARAHNLMWKAEQHHYWQTKNRFLREQPGVSNAMIQLRNVMNVHAKQMAVLALQTEVNDEDARAALEQGREMVESITPPRELITAAYQLAESMPVDREQQSNMRFMTDRVDGYSRMAEEAAAYLKDFENLLASDHTPPVEPEDAQLKSSPETAAGDVSEPETDHTEESNSSSESDQKLDSDAPERLPSAVDLEAMNAAELYASIQAMTEQLDEAFAENKAVELAEFKQIPLEEAKEQVYAPTTDQGPDLAEALNANQPDTSEEFKSFNEALNQAVQSSERIARQAENRLSLANSGESSEAKATETADQLKEAFSQDAILKAKMSMAASNRGLGYSNLQDLRSLMQQSYENASSSDESQGYASGGEDSVYDSRSFLEADRDEKKPSSIRMDGRKALAQALPGRRFDMDSSRKGWIFVDTWYMIGPWNLGSGQEFEEPLPPETIVDLAATYAGKQHPATKEAMQLSWHFIQSGSMRINPPDVLSSSIYFAYTEIFCANAMDVVVAVASDDRAKLWINDMVVFQDVGLSNWRLDEGFRRVLLKPGYNTMLLRLENGPEAANFSVLMCPAEVVSRK
jgi:hypothetical protein